MFLVLLLANAAFFGWAHWIDVPAAAQAGERAPALPVLALADAGGGAAAGTATAAGAATAAARAGQGLPGAPNALAGNGAQRCRTLGPFTDPATARAVADVLRTRKLSPRSRTVNISLAGGTVSAHWLDVDLGAGESDPPLAALRGRLVSAKSATGSARITAAGAAEALRGVAFSDCPAPSTGG